jgi:hypothetical protein
MTDLIAVQKIAGWERLKMLVLESVSSPMRALLFLVAPDGLYGPWMLSVSTKSSTAEDRAELSKGVTWQGTTPRGTWTI